MMIVVVIKMKMRMMVVMMMKKMVVVMAVQKARNGDIRFQFPSANITSRLLAHSHEAIHFASESLCDAGS